MPALVQVTPGPHEAVVTCTPALERLRTARPAAHSVAEFRERGLVLAPGLLDEVAQALRDEAIAQRAAAETPKVGPRIPVAVHRQTGETTPVATGAVLIAVHAALEPWMRALSGQMLVGSVAAYGYFEGHDEVVLHKDTTDSTDIVLLTTAAGAVGPLSVRPELEGFSQQQLGMLESHPAWDRCAGVPMHYPMGTLGALRGARLPHHRNRKAVDGLAAVAVLHYRSPF